MSIYNSLYDWQKEVVNKFKDRNAFGLFLDMGLGKTPTGMAFAEVNLCEKVLIITINAKATEDEKISGSWLNWASKSDMSYTLHNKKDTLDFSGNDVLVVNYESLFSRSKTKKEKVPLRESIIEFIKSCKGKNVALIIDESHKLKNIQSKQSLAIFKIQKLLEKISNEFYTYLLTGTPFTTSYIDLYAQLKALGCPLNKGEFIDKFCIRGNLPGLLGWQQPIVGYRNTKELFDLVHNYAITMKSDEVVNLPEQIIVRHTSPCSLSFKLLTQEKAYYKDIKKMADLNSLDLSLKDSKGKQNNPFYRNIAYPKTNWLAETVGAFWLRARQLSIGFQGNAEEAIWFDRRRLAQLKEFLEINEDNYVIFYNYTPELLEIYDICSDLGYNIDIYCGEIKSEVWYSKYCEMTDEEKLVHKKNVIIANFQSGSTGKNWQEYNKCIIFSMPLFRDWQQGIKRVHRLGQKNTVIYHIFSQENWLDQSMQKSLDESIEYDEDLFKNALFESNKE